VSDQAIVIGWAGYDERVDYLPPEHWLVLQFRDAMWQACQGGALARCGPDGKLLVRIREDAEGFALEQVLATMQHPAEVDVIRLVGLVTDVLREHYERLQARDRRWWRPWEQVDVLVNPAGPLIEGGSRGDNGQTGRKLVMDYYGPRVPLGGGALYGKHPGHVDRLGATRARELAIKAVKGGAGECMIRACYAPSIADPLDVTVEVLRGDGRVERERLVMSSGRL
jgi:S-adenosylmethionine synthetase